jgi:uncharacterized membrane protein
MIALHQDAVTGDVRIVLTPNASMTPRQARLLAAVMAAAMGAIALFFASMGAWMVLPFSGAEWLLLACALWVTQRKASNFEVITIQEDWVRVECRRVEAKHLHQFQRPWLRLERLRPNVDGHPSRLFLRLHRNSIEIGSFLIESERETLAHELQRVLLKKTKSIVS